MELLEGKLANPGFKAFTRQVTALVALHISQRFMAHDLALELQCPRKLTRENNRQSNQDSSPLDDVGTIMVHHTIPWAKPAFLLRQTP